MRQNPLVSKYNAEVSDFFGLPLMDIDVHFLESRADYDKVALGKTNDWEVGFSDGHMIYILNKDKFASDSSHTESDFEKVLKHEISHVYFDSLKPDMTPYWLNEGIACYVAGQNEITPKDKITVEALKRYHDNVDEKIYMIGRYVVEKIVDKYDKAKLIELIRLQDSEKLYADLQDMFGRTIC